MKSSIETLQTKIEIGERLRENFPKLCKQIKYNIRELEIQTDIENIETLLFVLKNNTNIQAKMLLDIVCVDCLNIEEIKLGRYKMIYVLNSIYNNLRIHVVTFVENNGSIKTSTKLFESSVWLEREIWDMYGVYFEEHPDLRRILTDYGFSWYPLKKDFPVTGYIEVYYDVNDKKIIYKPVELMQEYRNYGFGLTWGDYERKVYLEKVLND